MKLIFILTYIVLSSHLYSQISGHYHLESVDTDKTTFQVQIHYDKSSNIIIPPISLNTHKILKNAKLLKVESLASRDDSHQENYIYRYEILSKDLKRQLPKLTIKYFDNQKEKYFELSTLQLPNIESTDSNWFAIGGVLLIVVFVLFFTKKRKTPKTGEIKIDLQTLWRANQSELFLEKALEDEGFSMDRGLLQEYYDQVKFAGIELNPKQKAQIEKNFKDKKIQIKTVEKEREDQFLASVLED